MLGIMRCTWSMEAVEAAVSAGVNLPSWRKERMLFKRKRAEADGERRMMGSGRRPGALDDTDMLGFAVADGGIDCDFLVRNGAASLRTCEKS